VTTVTVAFPVNRTRDWSMPMPHSLRVGRTPRPRRTPGPASGSLVSKVKDLVGKSSAPRPAALLHDSLRAARETS